MVGDGHYLSLATTKYALSAVVFFLHNLNQLD